MASQKEQQLIEIIRVLSKGGFYSGQAIADTLDVSRAYVWKLIQQLQELGLGIESVTGRGYCLQFPVELLDEESLKQISKEDPLHLLQNKLGENYLAIYNKIKLTIDNSINEVLARPPLDILP